MNYVTKALLSDGKNTIQAKKKGLIRIIRTPHRRKLLSGDGVLTLSAVVHAQMMLNAQVIQIRQSFRKKQKKTPQTR